MLNAAMRADRARLLGRRDLQAIAESQNWTPGEADRTAWERQTQGCNRSPLQSEGVRKTRL
jgi:hypothetical protein